jgi:hypothetical protein
MSTGQAGGGPAPAGSESRALVALTPASAERERATLYRQPAFLAHLLAVKDQHPQTRERRRATPQEAIAAYRAADALTKRN